MEFDSCISFRSGQQQAQMKTSRTHIRAKTPFFHQKAEQRVRNKAVNITMLATACNIWIHAMWLEWVWCTAPQMGLYLETFKSRSYIGEFCQLHRKSASWTAGSNLAHELIITRLESGDSGSQYLKLGIWIYYLTLVLANIVWSCFIGPIRNKVLKEGKS